MKATLSESPAARRQRAFRKRVANTQKLKAYTFYLRRREVAFLKAAFKAKFGHLPSLGARGKGDRNWPIARTTDQAGVNGAAMGGSESQLFLFGGE